MQTEESGGLQVDSGVQQLLEAAEAEAGRLRQANAALQEAHTAGEKCWALHALTPAWIASGSALAVGMCARSF